MKEQSYDEAAAAVRQLADCVGAEPAAVVSILASVVEQMPVGVIVVHAPSGRICLYNHRAQEILGHPVIGAERVSDYRSYGGIHNDGRRYNPMDYPTARAVVNGESVISERLTYLRPDGVLRELSVSAIPIQPVEQSSSCVVCTFEDITEAARNRAILAFLAESSGALMNLAATEQVPGALDRVAKSAVVELADWCIIDVCQPGGIYTRVAVACADPEWASLAERIKTFHPESSRQLSARAAEQNADILVERVTQEAVAATARDQAHHDAVTALGPRSFMSVPLHAGDRTLGALSLIQSRSLRHFEESDRAWLRAVGRRIAASLAVVQALDEREQARREAESANQTKDEFLAMLGHELRNPLAPLDAALRLMRLDAGAGPLRNEQLAMERQVKHLTRLVDDLLDVSRLIRGKVRLEREHVSVQDVLRRALEVAGPLIEQRRHHVRLAVPAEAAFVDGDEERLTQVFANLLTNAAKFTPEGGSIEVTENQNADGVCIEVRDQGIGMDAMLLPKVFDPFVQREAARTGLGLGLAIVRALVEQHAGRVDAYSEGLGKGSTFRVWLPRVQSAEGCRASKVPRSVGVVSRPRRVLIVDDNADAADLLGSYLRHRGHEVQVVYDAIDAIAVATTFVPEVALLDLGLPGMHGYQLAAKVRERGAIAARFVAISGYADEASRAGAAEHGFCAYFVKPVPLDELEELLAVLP